MPAYLSIATVAQIERALRDALPNPSTKLVKQLAKDYDTTLSTIYVHKARIQASQPPKPPSRGAKRIITTQMEEAIILLLDKEP